MTALHDLAGVVDTPVAILTAAAYLERDAADWFSVQLHHEDQLLADALQVCGLEVQRLDWANPAQDWSQLSAAIVRSAWDYSERCAEFAEWLARAGQHTRLFNSPALLRWNADKRYLLELAAAGIAIPPTRHIARGNLRPLREWVAESGWAELVIKPAVSAGARDTLRFGADQADALQARFAAGCAVEDWLLQPFLADVAAQGEVSLIVIDGKLTHAVRKRPAPGDFRVQDEHGGKVEAHTPSADECAFVAPLLSALPELPLYARVDLVRDAAGQLCLMELELIEPELFFRFCPAAATRLAEALCRRLAVQPTDNPESARAAASESEPR